MSITGAKSHVENSNYLVVPLKSVSMQTPYLTDRFEGQSNRFRALVTQPQAQAKSVGNQRIMPPVPRTMTFRRCACADEG